MRSLCLILASLPAVSAAQDVGPLPSATFEASDFLPYSAPQITWHLPAIDDAFAVTLPRIDRPDHYMNCQGGSLDQARRIRATGEVHLGEPDDTNIVVADRRAAISAVIGPYTRRSGHTVTPREALFVGVAASGLLPGPGQLCGRSLPILGPTAYGAFPWNQREQSSEESVGVVLFPEAAELDSALDVLAQWQREHEYTRVPIGMSPDISPLLPRVPTPSSTEVLPVRPDAVLLHRGLPFATFDGPDRLRGMDGRLLAERHGEVIVTARRQNGYPPENQFWDAAFLEYYAPLTHPSGDMVARSPENPLWSWSVAVPPSQQVMGHVVTKVRERKLSFRARGTDDPAVWEFGDVVGKDGELIGTWGSTGVASGERVLPFATHTRQVDDRLECRASPAAEWAVQLGGGYMRYQTQTLAWSREIYYGTGHGHIPALTEHAVDSPQMMALCVMFAVVHGAKDDAIRQRQ